MTVTWSAIWNTRSMSCSTSSTGISAEMVVSSAAMRVRSADTGRGDVLGLQAGDRAAFELDRAGIRWKEPRHEIEGGCFAGAVRTDQRVQGAVRDREVDAIDGVNAAEPLDETARGEHWGLARGGAAIDLRQFRILGDPAAGHCRGLDHPPAERRHNPPGNAD